MNVDLKLGVAFRYVSLTLGLEDGAIELTIQQQIVTLVFFTTYIVFQPPSTVIVRKIGPRIHLATITILCKLTAQTLLV